MKRHSDLDQARDLTKGGSLPSSVSRPADPRKVHQARKESSVQENKGIPAEEHLAALLRQAVLDVVARDRGELSSPKEELPMFEPSVPGKTEKEQTSPAVPVSSVPAEGPVSIPTWKRLFDTFLIVVASPVWFPLMIGVMLLVKFSSAGPVFYRQERVGYRGKRFMLYKFRSMRINADTQTHESHFDKLMRENIPMTKLDLAGDPRIIPWGRLLRASGLDELPQLYNVLRGEMSLVGPRPCTVREFERYLPWQQARVGAPPGLTGYWQVNGKNRTTFNEMIEMDIFYAEQMSPRLDLTILCSTFGVIAEQVLSIGRKSPCSPPFHRSYEQTVDCPSPDAGART